jgi:hypothetical protein
VPAKDIRVKSFKPGLKKREVIHHVGSHDLSVANRIAGVYPVGINTVLMLSNVFRLVWCVVNRHGGFLSGYYADQHVVN